ncbi:hypothetical protein HS125_01640 [bacterium]|nr:hypothetical protein [bacterium]
MKRARWKHVWSAALCALLASGCGPGGTPASVPLTTPTAAPAARPTPTRPPDDVPDDPIVGQAGGQLVRLSRILELERQFQFVAPPSGRNWREVVLEFRTAKLEEILLGQAILWKMDEAGLRPRVESMVARMVATQGEDGLKQSGLTLEKLTIQFAKSLLQEPEIKQLSQVSDSEMRAFYEAHKTDMFLTPEALSVRRIQRFPKPGQNREDLRGQMEQLRAEIEAKLVTTTDVGEQARIVSTFAKQYHEREDRANGGWIRHYRPAPTHESQAYLDAVYAAELYKLSPVLEVDGGFLLVYPDYHYGRRQKPYEESRAEILPMLVKKRQETYQDDWKRRILGEAGAAMYLEYLGAHLPPEPRTEIPAARASPATPGGG